MSGFPINPPSTPLVDKGGWVTRDWYRFFSNIQKVIGSDTSPVEDQQLVAGAPGGVLAALENASGEAPDLAMPPFTAAEGAEDFALLAPPAAPTSVEVTGEPGDNELARFSNEAVQGSPVTLADDGAFSISGTPVFKPTSAAFETSVPVLLAAYTVATLPAGAIGWAAYATDLCVFDGLGVKEATGAGTGGMVTHNGVNWVVAGTNSAASS